jgi:hypothetical protein
MERRWRKQVTVNGLLVLVAASALVMSVLRPPAAPDEGQAIVLAKAFLVAHNEFDYPTGYWVRAVWDQKRGTWCVGFMPATARQDGGAALMVEVSSDRSCRAASTDISFFKIP